MTLRQVQSRFRMSLLRVASVAASWIGLAMWFDADNAHAHGVTQFALLALLLFTSFRVAYTHSEAFDLLHKVEVAEQKRSELERDAVLAILREYNAVGEPPPATKVRIAPENDARAQVERLETPAQSVRSKV